MTKKLHVATSPLSNTIFAGTVLKDGRTWSASKQDVTIEAIVAVAEHALAFGKPLVVTKNDVPEFEITVKKLPKTEQEYAKRLQNAVEGELNGLAIDLATAQKIVAHVLQAEGA